MKKIKKIVTAVIMLTAITSTAAFAAGDNCKFTYNNVKGYGELEVTWNVGEEDEADATTTYVSKTYYAAVYLEAVDENKNNKIVDSSYKIDLNDITVHSSEEGINRFNSTHGVVLPNNKYKMLASDTCTDW